MHQRLDDEDLAARTADCEHDTGNEDATGEDSDEAAGCGCGHDSQVGDAERESFTLFQLADGSWQGQLHLSRLNGELVTAALDRQIDR
ncbi:MAG: hypothetical protein IT196_28300, partial [Acidimicrobiales bacterium]|nr:hypothetical protein [Acidimicrobiales bacterium]